MALNIFEEIDISSSGDTVYEGFEKAKANWAEMDTELHAARGGEATLDTRLDAIDTSVGDLETEVEAARGIEVDVDTRITAIETEITTARSGEDDLDTRIDAVATSVTDLSTELYTEVLTGYMQKVRFAYKDADEIYVYGVGAYEVSGTLARISGTLTLQKASGGTDIHYLYIDYSAIPADGILLADDLYFDTAEPASSTTKGGWYHQTATDDRCIFAIKTVSDVIQSFYHHTDNYVQYEAQKTLATDVDAGSAEEVSTALWVPVFSRQILATIELQHAATVAPYVAYWAATSGGSNHIWAKGELNTATHDDYMQAAQAHIVMAAQSFWVTTSVDADCDADIYLDGWYFMRGI